MESTQISNPIDGNRSTGILSRQKSNGCLARTGGKTRLGHLGEHGPQGLEGRTFGAYQILERVGAGGMGVVYRADDKRLNRTVAIKALSRTMASDALARKTVLREARRACRVSHPYVATVLDVLDVPEGPFVVMEYIEGRRLDHVVREDRPGVERITSYAREIAEALGAIHRAGLVHRDLKPSNVMVGVTGHVKVMDFGLAQELSLASPPGGDPSASSMSTETAVPAGAIAGTVPYMSPEQLRGQPLDARSDLFSFGVLLYEAVTGVHPFQRDSMLQTASAILTDPPGGGTEHPSLSGAGPLRSVIERLLQKNREHRYPNSSAILDDLPVVGDERPPVPTPRRLSRLVVGSAVVVAASVLVVGVYFGVSRWPRRGPPTGGRPVIAVLPFEDRTGEANGDLRGRMVADLIAADLNTSSLARCLSGERVDEILAGLGGLASRSSSLKRMRQATHVDWIVAGALYKEGDSFQATVALYRDDAKEPTATLRASAASSTAIAERAGALLRGELTPPGGKAPEAGPGLALLTSTSEEARLLEQAARKDTRELRYNAAIEKLEKALTLDSGFLLAQVRLAEALDRAGYGKRAREMAERALRTAERAGADAPQVLVLQARAAHAMIVSDLKGELAARRDLAARIMDDPESRMALSKVLLDAAKTDEALAESDLALGLDRSDPRAHISKSRALAAAKRTDDAAAELERADALFAELGSPVGRAKVLEARAKSAFVLGKYDEAKKDYGAAADALHAEGLDALAVGARKGAADADLAVGNLKAAEDAYLPLLAAARAAGNYRLVVNTLDSLGGTLYQSGDLPHAEQRFREARRLGEQLENSRLLMSTTLNLAGLLGGTGRGSEARSLAEEALVMARETGSQQGELLALTFIADDDARIGNLAAAVRAYREIVASTDLARLGGSKLGYAYNRLAGVLRDMGRIEEASVAVRNAVEVDRKANDRVLLAFALVLDARILIDLALHEQAEAAVNEAEDLGRGEGVEQGRLEALAPHIALARVALDATRGRWREAENRLAPLRQATAGSNFQGPTAEIFLTSCEIARNAGNAARAADYCRRSIEEPTADPPEQTAARAGWADAMAASGNLDGAAREGRRAVDEAERMSLPLALARACAALVATTSAAEEGARLAAKGRAALQRYVDSAPEDRRDSVQRRLDLSPLFDALERQLRSK